MAPQLFDLSAPSGFGVNRDGQDPKSLHPQLLLTYFEPLDIRSAAQTIQAPRPVPLPPHPKPAQSPPGDSGHLLGERACPSHSGDERRGRHLFAPGTHLKNTVSPPLWRNKITAALGPAGSLIPLLSAGSLSSQQVQGPRAGRGQTHKHTRSLGAKCILFLGPSSGGSRKCFRGPSLPLLGPLD